MLNNSLTIGHKESTMQYKTRIFIPCGAPFRRERCRLPARSRREARTPSPARAGGTPATATRVRGSSRTWEPRPGQDIPPNRRSRSCRARRRSGWWRTRFSGWWPLGPLPSGRRRPSPRFHRRFRCRRRRASGRRCNRCRGISSIAWRSSIAWHWRD